MNTLEFLYGTAAGRILLRPLISKPVSALSGRLLDTKASKVLIGPFAKSAGINRDDYILDDINSFNDFFCRRIKEGRRSFDMSEDALTSPCDGMLSAYKINDGLVVGVKQSRFDMAHLLRDRTLAKSFDGGLCLVFRLGVDNYHRYAWFDGGKKHKDRRIKGFYHTVRPVALSQTPVFIENAREYSVIDTDNFGRCVQMEVGAMLVGRIVNEDPAPARVQRGQEKGHFEYGGSTVIVLIGRDRAKIPADVLARSAAGVETAVKMGEIIGYKGK
ncbi:MAG: phosphatidylserine decarboxylase [Lachnospiraceae bacterium]|nr:phosphatidylserine decarboxylase [Lachnospiraceae bacterium]